jgi:hypothetical protein
MHDEAGRLVQNENLGVLEKDGERNVLRDELGTRRERIG